MEKKNVIITGAAGNLGKVTVDRFLSEGFRVHAIVSPRGNSDPEITNDLLTYPADLTDEHAAQNIVNKIIERWKTIDSAVFLAGGFVPGPLEETRTEHLNKMFSINFFTAFHLAKPLFMHMTTQGNGGRLVFVGARPALQASDGKKNVAYALSKALVFKFVELLNAEGKEKNVISSVIVPSIIDTPDNRKAMPDADFSKWVTPFSLAQSIHFLVSTKELRDPVLKVYNLA